MLDAKSQQALRAAIRECISADTSVLDTLRAEIRELRNAVRRVQPRSTTSISLVGTDGGNNQLQFDPYLVQLVRVVDSSNNEYCLEAVSPTTAVTLLQERQFQEDGRTPRTALGEMMLALGVPSLSDLSPMIPRESSGRPVSPSWVQVYRELVEWAVLLAVLQRPFGTDTLIITDGLLRSKVFAGNLFALFCAEAQRRIQRQFDATRRRIYLAGVAKHSKVLTRYRLAMSLEGVLQTEYPAFVEVPREIEERAYVWSEFARGDDRASEGGEANKFVGGKMFLVKFGSQKRDPIWPVDIFLPQREEAPVVIGSMLADATVGFPVPHYPMCLQRAHENAALVDFDFDILQDHIYEGIRDSLGDQGIALDTFRLQDADPAQKRYQ